MKVRSLKVQEWAVFTDSFVESLVINTPVEKVFNYVAEHPEKIHKINANERRWAKIYCTPPGSDLNF